MKATLCAATLVVVLTLAIFIRKIELTSYNHPSIWTSRYGYADNRLVIRLRFLPWEDFVFSIAREWDGK